LGGLAGSRIDLLIVPTTAGSPLNRTAYVVPTNVVGQLNDWIEGDAEIKRLQEKSADRNVATRNLYLAMRRRQIDALKGKDGTALRDPESKPRTAKTESLPDAIPVNNADWRGGGDAKVSPIALERGVSVCPARLSRRI
jgi:phospholipid-binding lipoprotein MlaA